MAWTPLTFERISPHQWAAIPAPGREFFVTECWDGGFVATYRGPDDPAPKKIGRVTASIDRAILALEDHFRKTRS